MTGIPHVLVLESAGLGDRSYVVHDGERAVVVDPQRDIDRVDRLLAEHGLTVSHVVETHVHNDYVSGGRELARRHGAVYVVPGGVDYAFDAVHAHDGDVFAAGALTVTAMHTPGHTPHHMSYAVAGDPGNDVVFTGGSMLYGTVGRPDLVAPDLTVKQAHDQWHSVHKLADALEGDTAIYPTHGFGSFCSATQAQGLSSTIDNERAINPALTQGEDEFVARTLAGLDVFPAYYAHMGPANAGGPADVDLSLPTLADAGELRARIDRGEWVVDLRSREVFARGHVPGAVNFDLDGAFINYLAWMMPWGTPVTLLGSTPEQVEAAQRELVRVGIDRPAAYAVGGVDAWLATPADAQGTDRVSFADLARVVADDPDAVLIDTRQVLEWETGHVASARFVPFYEVPDRLGEIPRDRPVYVYCGSGYRASAVASILQFHGFDNVVHVDDAFDNARKAGLSIESGTGAQREPGWTWTASRATVRHWAPPNPAHTH